MDNKNMTHDRKYLCTSTPSKVTKPIIQNEGAFHLQPRSVSVFTV